MSDMMSAIVDALRTPSKGRTVTPRTGPNAGQSRAVGQKRSSDDQYAEYQDYADRKKGEGTTPLAYNEWVSGAGEE